MAKISDIQKRRIQIMQFATFDPRPIQAAQMANDSIFAGAPQGVLGIEVTIPALAARCVQGNIDPQHSGGNTDSAAIEVALSTTLPSCPDEVTLATVRADLDSVGSMAVLQMRLSAQAYAEVEQLPVVSDSWQPCGELLQRICMVAEADRFARGGWPGPRPLPTRDNPWPEESATAESSRPLAAIAAAVSDFKVPLGNRVETMLKWLLLGEEPESYRQQVEKERADMIAALEKGAIKAQTTEDGKIAVVVSTHRAATSVGYGLAPVVVALNPSFRFQGGEPHAKFTVCQFTGGFVDLKAAVAELAALETGWGGSSTIIGSPQGVSSMLSIGQVAEIVAKHLQK